MTIHMNQRQRRHPKTNTINLELAKLTDVIVPPEEVSTTIIARLSDTLFNQCIAHLLGQCGWVQQEADL